MKFIDEFRSSKLAERLTRQILEMDSEPLQIMEICGGQTHAILKYGIDRLLEDKIEFLHGPGCPVCVTPVETIEKAIEIAHKQGIIFCTLGDMIRVPGSGSSLQKAKADGADVRILYSLLDAVNIAVNNPHREIVFFAIGFETTAPSNALAVLQAERLGLSNFSILSSMFQIPPAISILLNTGDSRIDALLAPGHVCTVTGFRQYRKIAQRYEIPIAVTGFEPVDILLGIQSCIEMTSKSEFSARNCYGRSVIEDGNLQALDIIDKVFKSCDREWRGIGIIPSSGLSLKRDYFDYDAEVKYDLKAGQCEFETVCIAGEILRGLRKPIDCPSFMKECTPENPLGAPMVSSEGACAAYRMYGNN